MQQVVGGACSPSILISSQVRPMGHIRSSTDLNHTLPALYRCPRKLCPQLQASHCIYGKSEARRGKNCLRSRSQLGLETRVKSTGEGWIPFTSFSINYRYLGGSSICSQPSGSLSRNTLRPFPGPGWRIDAVGQPSGCRQKRAGLPQSRGLKTLKER